MNKPLQAPPVADDDIGSLAGNGEQIWSPEQEAASARLDADPDHLRSLDDAMADVVAGHFYTHEEHLALMAERKRRWFADRNR